MTRLLPLILLSLYILLSLLPSLSTATITIAGTGAHFPSHPDRMVGTPWMEGYEYMARLQLLANDLDLCNNENNNNDNNDNNNATITTVPTDGLPVVLVTRGDDCSDLQKVETALSRIQPRGVVKYLVIYSDAVHPPLAINNRRQRQLSNKDDDDHEQEQEQENWDSTAALEELAQKIVEQHMILSSTTTNQKHQEDEEWPRRHDDYDHRMGVLHVSYKTGNALLRIIMDQSSQDKAYGGPRVLLDSSASSEGTFVRNLLFWIGISLMMVGCLCSFCLSVRLTDSPAQVAARPERRRRLTPDQVDDWFPDFQLNDADQRDREEDSTAHLECSICLDDMVHAGCYLRKLPCGHEFHADCIGKWLCERYATCPLCKLDLLPDDEDDDEEEDGDDESSIVDTTDIPNGAVTRTEEVPANRFSLWQYLVGTTLQRPDNNVAAVDTSEAAVTSDDQTPLLDDQDSV